MNREMKRSDLSDLSIASSCNLTELIIPCFPNKKPKGGPGADAATTFFEKSPPSHRDESLVNRIPKGRQRWVVRSVDLMFCPTWDQFGPKTLILYGQHLTSRARPTFYKNCQDERGRIRQCRRNSTLAPETRIAFSLNPLPRSTTYGPSEKWNSEFTAIRANLYLRSFRAQR